MPRFLDPALIVAALAPLVPETVAEVVEFTAASRADPARAAPKWPRISVVAERSAARPPRGISDSGAVEETILLLVQVRTQSVTVADAAAMTSMLDIRDAIYAALQGVAVIPGWKPPRYAGGQLVGVDSDAIYTWGDRYILPRIC